MFVVVTTMITYEIIKQLQELKQVIAAAALLRAGKKEVKAAEKVKQATRFTLIKKGDRGQSVEEIQIMLNMIGKNQLIVDGDYGAKTLAAVVAFQKAYKLKPDGIVGQLTYAKLIEVNRKKARKGKYKIE